jgi:hypothetical protein
MNINEGIQTLCDKSSRLGVKDKHGNQVASMFQVSITVLILINNRYELNV